MVVIELASYVIQVIERMRAASASGFTGYFKGNLST